MTSLVERIRGKVARVLSDRDVALNKGSLDGVKVGMVFKILGVTESTINDPDTGEHIGTAELEFEKTAVKVTSVQERLSIASTFRTRKINVGGTGLGILASHVFQPPKWETQVETFQTDEPIDEAFDRDVFVKIGDVVVQDTEASAPLEATEEKPTPSSPK